MSMKSFFRPLFAAADKPHIRGGRHRLNPIQKIQGACEDCLEV